MEVKNYYIENGLTMLNMQTDYKAEEEWGASDLIKKSQAGEMPCQLVTFAFDKKDIPVLVFNCHSCLPTDIEWINGGELVRKLKSEKSNFQDLKKYLFPKTERPYGPFLNPEKMDKGFICNNMFLASFSHGDVLLIAPNPYVILLEEKELKKKDKYRYKIDLRVNKESLWKNIKERRKQQFTKTVQAIKEMYQSYKKNGVAIRGASGPFHTGINIYFLPKEDVEIIKKYNIFPYELSGDEKFIHKEKNTLKKEISERIAYLKEVKHQEALLEKVKKFLEKKKKGWFFLGSPRKFDDGVWHFWLNPWNQNIYETGWYTLEELKQWGNDNGPVIKQK